MGGDPDLYVDIDALEELGRQLHQIKAALDEADERVDAFDERLGSRRIEEALDDFVSGWRDGRKDISEALDGLFDALDGAITAYNENEARLSRAAEGGG